MPTFDDATIEKLFGAEDAENEIEERFKEYFYYNSAYDSLVADLPIRILVGHKGVGKSALLKRAYLDDIDESRLAVWIRPDGLNTSKTRNTHRTLEARYLSHCGIESIRSDGG